MRLQMDGKTEPSSPGPFSLTHDRVVSTSALVGAVGLGFVLAFRVGLSLCAAGSLRFGLLCTFVSSMRFGVVSFFSGGLGLRVALHLRFRHRGRNTGCRRGSARMCRGEGASGKHAGKDQSGELFHKFFLGSVRTVEKDCSSNVQVKVVRERGSRLFGAQHLLSNCLFM